MPSPTLWRVPQPNNQPLYSLAPHSAAQYYSGVDQYFVKGVDTLWEQGFWPKTTTKDPHYYLNRLSKVRAKYNLFGAMTNVRQVPLPPFDTNCPGLVDKKKCKIGITTCNKSTRSRKQCKRKCKKDKKKKKLCQKTCCELGFAV